jgi:hypothetical protein
LPNVRHKRAKLRQVIWQSRPALLAGHTASLQHAAHGAGCRRSKHARPRRGKRVEHKADAQASTAWPSWQGSVEFAAELNSCRPLLAGALAWPGVFRRPGHSRGPSGGRAVAGGRPASGGGLWRMGGGIGARRLPRVQEARMLRRGGSSGSSLQRAGAGRAGRGLPGAWRDTQRDTLSALCWP